MLTSVVPEALVEAVPDIDLALKLLSCTQFDCTILSLTSQLDVSALSSTPFIQLQEQQPLLFVCADGVETTIRQLIEDANAKPSNASDYKEPSEPVCINISNLNAVTIAAQIEAATNRFATRKLLSAAKGIDIADDGAAFALNTATARSTVRHQNPELFSQLVDEYASLMDVSLDRRAFRITANASTRLSIMSKTLGDVRAGPRDVIELFGAALKAKSKNVTLSKAKAYSDIALLMALELMGYLVSYYRNLVCKKES